MIKALYVHVPFCDDICSYCDFVRVKTHPKLIEPYLFALQGELNTIPEHAIDTIYIGGGTPSALNEEQLETLLSLLEPFSEGVLEYTIEMNPESVTLEKAQLCQHYGINRVSFGVQSFDVEELKMLNRHHDVTMIHQGLKQLKSVGIDNVSIDLIYGLPQQSLETWKSNLEEALKLPIQHVSLYALTIEENSAFGRQNVQAAPAELEEDMYFYALERLKEAGFNRYEISNFTQNHPSLHNQHYWHMDEYVGVGPGAVSYVDHSRIENTTNLMDYANFKFHKHSVPLSVKDEQFEMIMMGLRVEKGIELKVFKERFRHDLTKVYAQAIDQGIQKQWLILDDQVLRCSDSGLGLLHEVLLLFMDELA